MSSKRLKSLRVRTRVEDSENDAHGAESPKSHLNKNLMPKNKIALTDLTNKNLVNTHSKKMVTASDMDTDSDSEGKKAIRMPQVGRQTRSKGKIDIKLNSTENKTQSTVENSKKMAKNPEVVIEEMTNVVENLSNSGKVFRHTRRTTKESDNSCQSSPSTSKAHSLKETLKLIHEQSSDVEEEDEVPNLKKSSAATESSNSCKSSPAASKTRVPPSEEKLEEISDAEKESDLPKSKGSSKLAPPSRDSEKEIVEAPRVTRQTRNMSKSQITETQKKNLMSPKPTSKNAKSNDTPVRQTRSPAALSPILRSTRKSPAASTPAETKKPKRKTALERWIEKAGDSILPDGSRTRQKSRSFSIQSNVSSSSSSMLSDKLKSPKIRGPAKLTSPKSGMKLKSPGSASKIRESKKVPVWKTEPKPDAIKSVPDDIYGFEYDPSDCKPAKKKRTRKTKKDDDVFKSKASKVKAAPKQMKRLQRTVVAVIEKPKSPIKSPVRSKPTEKKVPTKTTPLLKSVAEKLNNLTQNAIEKDSEIEDAETILSCSPIANHSSTIYDTTLPEQMDSEHHETCLDEQEKSTESGVLAGDFGNENQQTKSPYSRVEMDMEHLFGFDQEPENEPPVATEQIEKQLVKSTPIKQRTVAECFSSVSPVLHNRKYSKATRKSCTRPARIDENVARDLIYGIRPLQPVKEKATRLMQYIQEVGENHEEEEHSVRKVIDVPQTPPVAFTEPVRKSYSKREMRNVKRKIMLIDDDGSDVIPFDDDDDDFGRKKQKKKSGKTLPKKNKRDEEVNKWEEMMNSHFEEVDKFNLSS